MSTKNKKNALAEMNKVEVDVYIKRNYGTQKKFCGALGLNYDSFRKWMSGDNNLVGLAERVYKHINQSNYNINLIIKPETKLHIEQAV